MKSVFITGAGRGLGREVARAFAKDGYGVTLFSRSEPALRETEKSIKEESPGAKLLCVGKSM
jgi:short-subunit dehydrogenase